MTYCINFLILTKFHIKPFSKVLISNLILVFENFEPKCPNWDIWAKKYQLSNLNKILLAPYFEGSDFKSGIGFQKVLAQLSRSRHFRPKRTNFLILTKFCINSFSKVLIWNLTLVMKNLEPKCPNLGIFDQNVPFF